MSTTQLLAGPLTPMDPTLPFISQSAPETPPMLAAPSTGFVGSTAAPVSVRAPLRFPLTANLASAAAVRLLSPTMAAAVMLPGLGDTGELALPLPDDAAPLQTEARSAEIFGSPLLTRTQVVVSRQDGLSAAEQRALGEFALDVSRHEVPGLEEVGVAVPLTSAGGIAPGAEPGPASVITYLAFDPGASVSRQTRLARDYIAAAPIPPQPL